MTAGVQRATARLAESAVPQDVLHLEGLTVRYPGAQSSFTAVDDVDLVIRPGEQVALVGESGSGKTTLALAIAGFLSGGEILSRRMDFQGEPLTRTARPGLPRRTDGIAMIFQDAMTSLDPVWTIGSQLKRVLAGAGVARRDRKDRAIVALHDVGLTDADRVMKARPYELSGGMRQRAMLAIALSGDPQLLIADEPTSALDSSMSRVAMDLIRTMAQRSGTALLVVTHDIRLAAEFTDRMVVMYRGEIVETGDPAVLAAGAEHAYTRGLMGCVPTLESRSLERLPVLADYFDPAGPAPRSLVGAVSGGRDVA